jgi:transposase-like protein
MDEIPIKVKGPWKDHCRAVDKKDQTIDSLLTENKDTSELSHVSIKR